MKTTKVGHRPVKQAKDWDKLEETPLQGLQRTLPVFRMSQLYSKKPKRSTKRFFDWLSQVVSSVVMVALVYLGLTTLVDNQWLCAIGTYIVADRVLSWLHYR